MARRRAPTPGKSRDKNRTSEYARAHIQGLVCVGRAPSPAALEVVFEIELLFEAGIRQTELSAGH